MAKTPLFGMLKKAALLARHAQEAGRPLDELWGADPAAQVDRSRRHFLKAAGLAALAGAIPGCAAPPKMAAGQADVAIVGAGIAGLTAAYRLRQAGVRVRVFEAQNRIGGRMLSLRNHFPDGQVAELGGELIDSTHTYMRALAQELGIALDDLQTDDPALERDVWYFGGQRYTSLQVAQAFVPVAQAILKDLEGLEEGEITFAEPRGAEALDQLSITQWLDSKGVSGWLRKLIEVAYTTEMGLECEEQSALNLLTLIGTDSQHFEVFGESDERFHVRGGNDLIVQGLAERLGAAVETNLLLESMRQSADGRYLLTLTRGASTREIPATHVVIAIPFTMLRQVRFVVGLPPVQVRAIQQLRYGTNAKLMIGFEERSWRSRQRSNGSVFTDLPLQTTWETSRLQGGRHGILTNFVGGRHGLEIGLGTPREQADLAVSQLDAIFPGITGARRGVSREARFHWPTNPYVRGSYACFTPGQWTKLRGAIGGSVGRVLFAGEHCSLGAQGFMEGGCETGLLAAAAILSDLDVATPQASLIRRLAYGKAMAQAA